MLKELKVYVSDYNWEEDAIAVRYMENGERHTTWFRSAGLRSLGMGTKKTYKITVEQLPDEYI